MSAARTEVASGGDANIRLARAYDPPSGADGTRILVERLWPRGVTKAALRIDGWAREVAPSTALRTWFGHDPARWDEFRARYARELEARPEAWRPLVSAARRGTLTLVFSSRDTVHNNAVALQQFLLPKLRRRAASRRTRAATRPSSSVGATRRHGEGSGRHSRSRG